MKRDKILIIQLGRFGDLILFTPVFRLIKQKFPNTELYLLAGRKNYEVVLANPYIDQIIKLDKSPIKIINTISNIRRNYYKYWIDPRDHYSKESRILAKLAKAQYKIGYNHPNQRKVFNIDIVQNEQIIHHSLIGINSLAALNIELPRFAIRPELFFYKNEQFSATTQYIINNLNKYIIINLSASANHKMWQTEKWIQFIEKTNLLNNQIVLNYMPTESINAEQIKSYYPNIILHQPSNIRDVMAIIYYSNAVITPDTSIVHIASAFNKDVFALYSGLDNFYNKFHPTSDQYVTVRADSGDNGIQSISSDSAIDLFNNQFKQLHKF